MLKKLKRISCTFTAAAMVLTANSLLPMSGYAADSDIFESECELLGEDTELWTSIYETQLPGYSGDGFAYLTAKNIKFEVEAPEEGMYEIDVRYAQILSKEGRLQTLAVNGSEYIHIPMNGRIISSQWCVSKRV